MREEDATRWTLLFMIFPAMRLSHLKHCTETSKSRARERHGPSGGHREGVETRLPFRSTDIRVRVDLAAE